MPVARPPFTLLLSAGVDFACEINGQLCGVSVTRGHVTRLLDSKASVSKSDAAGLPILQLE